MGKILFLSAIILILFSGNMSALDKLEVDWNNDTVSFEANFSEAQHELTHAWHLEGHGNAQFNNGKLALQDTGEGVVLWIKKDFPPELMLQFDLSFSNNRGIGVFFISAKGVEGEDILDALPERDGKYGHYTSGKINCYGFSLHRYFPDGRHNAGSNTRKNSGFHLVNHAEPDPVIKDNQTYHVRIEKNGGWLRLWVDGNLIHDWKDDGTHGAILKDGKVGFRLRGHSSCTMYLDNITITSS